MKLYYCILLGFMAIFWTTESSTMNKPLIPYPLHDFLPIDPATEEFIRSLVGRGYLPDTTSLEEVTPQPNYYSNAIYQQNGYGQGYYYHPTPNTTPNIFPGYFSLNGGGGGGDGNGNNDGFSFGNMPKFEQTTEYLPMNSFVMNNNEFYDSNNEYLKQLPTVTLPTTPGWTRATTTKDTLVAYFEQTLDKILSQGFAARKRVPLPNYLEDEMLLPNNKKKSPQNTTTSETIEFDNNDEIVVDGSGIEPISTTTTKTKKSIKSSISGISKVMPNIPKVPLEFQNSLVERNHIINTQAILPYLMPQRPIVPDGGFGPISQRKNSNIRRHPGKPKSVKEFQYGSKPTYQQGIMRSLLDFFGIPKGEVEPMELDHVLTQWILDHSPKTINRVPQQKRINNNNKLDTPYEIIKKFIAQSVQPLCNPQPEVVQNFDIQSFMGQWFQVMYSPMMASSSCSIMSYNLLDNPTSNNNNNHLMNGIGSVFQTLEYSTPKITENFNSSITSGYGVVSRLGQIIYQNSNNPEEVIVHVIHVGKDPIKQRFRGGRYEYAILSVNCNYPLYVIARDPLIFKVKYEKIVNQFLQKKGLINGVSRFMNILTPVDFNLCILPPNMFNI